MPNRTTGFIRQCDEIEWVEAADYYWRLHRSSRPAETLERTSPEGEESRQGSGPRERPQDAAPDAIGEGRECELNESRVYLLSWHRLEKCGRSSKAESECISRPMVCDGPDWLPDKLPDIFA